MFPSVQLVPSGAVMSEGQAPFTPSQCSAGSHGPPAARHTIPALPAGCAHAPDPSHSSTVQALESAVHAEPAATKQFWLASLQMSAHSGPPAHGSPACVHVPPAQVSTPLQKIPSSHGFVLFT